MPKCSPRPRSADAAGFDSIWLTEHHFTDDGYLPAMMPAAAAIAARTKRVEIGTFVLLAPFQHPLKLAEDVAVVDVISGGRIRLGIGQGYRQEEFDGFGVPREQRLGPHARNRRDSETRVEGRALRLPRQVFPFS